jgi:hypothetical protein
MTEDQMLLLECLADDDEWQEWERQAKELNVPIDYYIAEFV